MQQAIKQITIRELQHNLATYIKLAQVGPISVNKYGRQVALLVNPEKYAVKKTKAKIAVDQDVTKSDFIGMHKQRQEWQDKSHQQAADSLRQIAWYGG